MDNSSEKDNENQISIKEFLGISKWIIGLFYRSSPGVTIISAFVAIFREVQGILTSLIFAKTLDILIQIASSNEKDLNDLIPIVIVSIGFRILIDLNIELENYTGNILREKSAYLLRRELYLKIQALGVQSLEDPETTNRLSRISDYIWDFPYFLRRLLSFFARLISAVVAGVVVATFIPILIPILLIIAIPRLIVEKRYLEQNWKMYLERTEENRIAYANSDILLTPQDVKEVFVIGAHKFLDDKFYGFAKEWLEKLRKFLERWYRASFLMGLVNNIFLWGAYITIFKRFINGFISVGDLTFQIRAIDSFYSAFFWGLFEFFNIRQTAIKFKDGKSLFDQKPLVADGTINYERSANPPSISFKNVDFKYPNADKLVIDDLNLEIKPGEKVAIVGKNGAGKTTLVKLISRFYSVTKGELLIDEKFNINDLKIDSWYKNLGVLYQDYNNYHHLSAKENIYIGDTTKEMNMDEIINAADSSDALDFIEDYKNGFDTILGERYKGGIRPSTGQWQKIAIARFFYRNAPFVIFDEPTAAIDAESEYKIFNKIYDFFKNKTVIIISHRFSTVRNADRIIVLDKGKIIEEGSHEELMQKKGQYAKAFKLQAEGYNK